MRTERLFPIDPEAAERLAEELAKSPLLDPAWYRQTCPDIGDTPVEAARHYLEHGAGEGRNPHPLFDTKFYLQRNPDVAASGINPLVHYILYGAKDGCDPHPLFDAKFYLKQYPDVAASGMNPLVHYILHETDDGVCPHPLFDAKYYLQQNKDVAAAGNNPLVHYLVHGWQEGRDPNPFFDTDWYLALNPEVASAGTNPLIHYFTIGESKGLNPSPSFDVEWYLDHYPDLYRAGAKPLEHFLLHGRNEGRRPRQNLDPGRFAAVTEAEIYTLKTPSLSREVALFVTHSPHGQLKPHVRHYLDSLKRQGIAVVLIVAADRPFSTDTDLVNAMDGLFVRCNEGYDFAAWAHVLRLHPELYDAKILYFLNDSLFGPTNDAAFGDLLTKVRNSTADFVGLTESYERGWHIQSYFLALKPRALSAVALHKFINGIVSQTDKDKVITEYEIRFAPTLKAAGFNCEAIFASTTEVENRTIFHWKALFMEGFPFIKVTTVRDSRPGVETSDWREVLAGQGYDVSLAERSLAEASPSEQPDVSWASTSKPPFLSSGLSAVQCSRPKIAFIGPWNYDNGLAVASRAYIPALRRSGFSVNFHPIRRPFHVHHQVAPSVDVCDFSGDADVAVIHLNPDGWPGLLIDSQKEILKRARISIGLWVWEMAEIPENWFPAFNEVDAIWTPSRYCADVFATKAKVSVDVIPHVVMADRLLPDPVRAAAMRRELGLLEQDRIILYAFDGSSYLVRKNPFALIRAFARSGLAERGWKLVLKVKHLFDTPKMGKLLQQQVEDSSGVLLINRSVSKATMNELMHAADIYASPHCAEGFGLTIAEAMATGKIVVATDYSGSRDFLDSDCGFPVRYRLHLPDDDHGHYTRAGGVWAQVDDTHLADSLVRAADLVAAGDSRIGDAARARIESLLSVEAVAAKMRGSVLRLLENFGR